MKEPNSIEECLKVLEIIKANREYKGYMPLLEKIERYVRGEIKSSQLLKSSGDKNEDSLMRGIVFKVLNKIINYQEKDIRYYICLPRHSHYPFRDKYWIVAGRVNELGIPGDHMETVGPEILRKEKSKFMNNDFIEITGDFSSIPAGTILSESDWWKIIAKYPHIHRCIWSDEKFSERLYMTNSEDVKTFLEVVSETESRIENGMDSHDNGSECLPQEVIDSIEFEIPEIYLPIKLVRTGEFGTFKDILEGKYINRPAPESQIIDVLRKRFRGVSAIDKGSMAFLESEKELMLARLRNERARLLGFYNYAGQLSNESWDEKAKQEGAKSFRDQYGLPERKVSPENQAKIEEITKQIEEIERNWDERANR